MTRPLICKCGHDKEDHNNGEDACSKTTVKDFRIALSKKSNMKFCGCKAYEADRVRHEVDCRCNKCFQQNEQRLGD